jgi:hypothetical protein
LSVEHIAGENGGTGCVLLAPVLHKIVVQYEGAVCDLIMLAENVSQT